MPNFIPKKPKRDEDGNIIYSSLKRKTPLKAKAPLKAKLKMEKVGKDVKQRKKRPKSQKTLIKELDKWFSLYIRLRDSKPFGFKYFKCPTCGRVLPFEQADCSHYYGRMHMNTRYDEDNTCAECSYCNRFDSSHLIALGDYLKRKLGEQRYQLLRVKANIHKKWECWELEQLIKYYKARIEQIKETRLTEHNI